VTTGTQTLYSANSALQDLTVNKFIELVSKIIALCTKTDNSNITKMVTELTREILQLDCSQPASTVYPTCPDPAPYQVPSTITSFISASQPNSASFPGEANGNMIKDLIEPSPVIGKNVRKEKIMSTELVQMRKKWPVFHAKKSKIT
jgi:hypothetical protein